MEKVKTLTRNSTAITTNAGHTLLVSYERAVAAKLKSGEVLKTDDQVSRTTGLHIAAWLDGRSFMFTSQDFFDRLFKESN